MQLSAGHSGPAQKKGTIMEPELPGPWDAYLRLQDQLAETNVINHRSWALEAGLDAIIEAASAKEGSPERNIATAIGTAERRERHRARVLRIKASECQSPSVKLAAATDAAEAPVVLHQLRAGVSQQEWLLIVARAEGVGYDAIAKAACMTSGALRVKVSRVRQTLALQL